MPKIYPVKSNAARAAKKYGLGRDALLQVEGGWTFNEPNPLTPEGAKASAIEACAEFADGIPLTDPSHSDYDARAAHTVEPTTEGNGGNATKTKESNVKTKTKKAKAAKPAKAKAARKRNDNGIGAQVIAALKARWTPLADLLKMTGWLPHTTRAYISVQGRKLKLTAERRKHEGETQYRFV